MSVHNFVHGSDDGDHYIEDPVTLISRLDISDPLHLHPDDSTALNVVSKKLKGTKNYQESHRVASGSIPSSSQRNQASAFVSNMPNRNNFQRSNQNFNNRSRPNNLSNNRQGGGSALVCENWKNVSNNNSVGSSSSSGFTDEQIATFISLIKDNKIGKNVQVNMAGANQHMTYIDKELDNVFDISHLKIKVGHPNGTEGFISKIGNLKLSNGLILYDVLVIPEYCVALISVHKLVKENKIIVAFDESRWYRLFSLDRHQFIFSRDVKFFETSFPFKDSVTAKIDTTNVFQDINHVNLFDIEIPEMPNDDKRVDPSLNSNKNSQSDSSHSLVSNGDVTSLEDNIFSEGNLDQNPNTPTQGTQNLRSSRQRVFPRNYNDFVMDSKVKYGLEKKAIGSKWIFKIKYKYSGEIDRYKARLVAQGFGQKEGIDYEETFSPVVKMVTVRCLLNVVVSNSWHVFQLDVNNAFIYGDLIETVYMKPPKGYFPLDNKVCKLKRSLYGLKQAPRQWNAKLTLALIENAFSQSKSDYSLYTKSDNGIFLALLVYVDDI
ncbi:ribonuclease H-like domain-containing protein [Tanacetum coccineum]